MLIKSKTKVVVVASEAHKMGDLTVELLEGDDMPAFFKVPATKTLHSVWKQDCYSNRARVYFARELSERSPQMRVVCVNPGAVRSDIGRNMPACMRCVAAPFTLLLKSPDQAAQLVVDCAVAEENPKGGYLSDGKLVEIEGMDPAIQKDLWNRTEDFIKKHE